MVRVRAFWHKIQKQVSESLLETATLIVAIVSIVVGWNLTQTQKTISILEKRPYLVIEHITLDAEETNGLLLKNIGHGSAIINSFTVYKNYEATYGSTSWQYFYDVMNNWFPIKNFLSEGYAMGAGKDYNIFLLSTGKKSKNAAIHLQCDKAKCEEPQIDSYYNSDTKKAIHNLKVVIEYKSVFEDVDDRYYRLTYSGSASPSNLTETFNPETISCSD